jgi:uncharacterized protein
MQKIDGRFVYSASDLNNFLECRHLAELERRVALKELERPERDETVELIARKGVEHEALHFARLKKSYGERLVAFEDRAENTDAGLRAAEAATVAAMAAGAEIIYQATFFDGTFLGRADFLRRVDDPGSRWGWNYEVLDTKLALSTKPYFLLQLCNYSEHIARITGSAPQHGYIILGSGVEQRFRMDDYGAYYRYVKRSFLADVASVAAAYPLAVGHCSVCPWRPRCEKQRLDDDHLSVVANIRRDQIAKLESAGIRTLTALAHALPAQRPRGMREDTYHWLHMQAERQLAQRRAEAVDDPFPYSYAFREATESGGLAHLPEPAPGDVFFDIEGDPLYAPGRALEYLWGVYLPDEDRYLPFWAHDLNAERSAFEALVDFLKERARTYPGMHVYHYAPYETTALRRLMGTYGSREDDIDAFLRNETFVDLYPIVRQSLWISQPSYSIKKVEKLYRMKREASTKAGDDSIVKFEAWLATGDDSILADIERYNDEDCRSTHQLREWLVRLRAELNASRETPIPWFTKTADEPKREPQNVPQLAVDLLSTVSAPTSQSELRAASEKFRAHWLLGNLMQYHRREAKPEWWTFFNRRKHPDDLEEHDKDALGGLRLIGDIPPWKAGGKDRNLTYAYAFEPQEHHLKSKAACAHTGKSVDIIRLDDDALRVDLKMPATIDPPALRAIIPPGPLNHEPKQRAVEAIAREYLDGVLETRHPAVADMLFARKPGLSDRKRGAIIQPNPLTKESVSATIAALDDSYLFVQGPPGSGKSTSGAWAIVDLIAAGKSVGVMANGHKAVHNLLCKVEETALARGVRFSGAHKESDATEGSAYVSPHGCDFIQSGDDYALLCDEGRRLISGSSHAWAAEKLARTVDYLFIDEAGQISLADALIAAVKAHNVVLLGDPLQLPQVSQGSHPLGTDLSILEHLLGDAATVPTDAGVFLEWSYRMHPDIAGFISQAIYEGRLRSAERTAGNRVRSHGLTGSGLRYLPVEHEGNSRCAPEESERIVAEVERLLAGTLSVDGKAERPLTQADIMIVAPYNVQRRKIGEDLRKAGFGGVRVGTVDKFQGQEAPVVFYSMTTSSAENIPRGKEFLFDKNRFNVAVSRAQCLSVLLCSPRLLDVPCRTPQEMLLVNLLCGFVEAARRPAEPEELLLFAG